MGRHAENLFCRIQTRAACSMELSAFWRKGRKVREKTTKHKRGRLQGSEQIEVDPGEKFLAQSGKRLLEFWKKCRDMCVRLF
ncbi:hypothetical protein TNCV_4653991 [Trichonephila clavipes]|nr:hypothetical protein TNCV_4653991 [Trichonephila clavipes]